MTTPDPTPDYPRDVPPEVLACVCHKPTLIATFRREQLVALELRHLRSAGCAYPTQALDVETWRKPW